MQGKNSVLCQIYRARFVRRDKVLDAPNILGGQCVANAKGRVARKAIGAVRQLEAEDDTNTCCIGEWLSLPYMGIEAGIPAVQTTGDSTGVIVQGQNVLRIVKRETAAGDAIAHTADNGAEIGLLKIGRYVAKSKHNITNSAVAKRNAQALHDAAIVENRHGSAVAGSQLVGVNGAAVRQFSKDTNIDLFFHTNLYNLISFLVKILEPY